MKAVLSFLLALLAVAGVGVSTAAANLLVVSELFTGRLQAYTTPGAAPTQFAQLSTRADSPFALLSGIHFHAASNRLYVSELDRGGTSNGRVHVLDATTRAILQEVDFDFGVAGVTVGGNGDIYLSDAGSDMVRRYNSNFVLQADIQIVGANATSGLAFNGNDLYISTFGAGIFRYDGSSVSSFVGPGSGASAQMAFDADGNLYAGHGLGFSNFAHRFDASGTEFLKGGSPFLEVTEAMVGSWGGSSSGTSPSGLTFDGNGNLVVAALGRSNPFDSDGAGNFGERGGLFLFDRDGNLLDTFASGSRSYSGVAFVSAIPEPSSLAMVGLAGLLLATRRRR